MQTRSEYTCRLDTTPIFPCCVGKEEEEEEKEVTWSDRKLIISGS